VVTVFDHGFLEGSHQPYIVMERLNGWDLEEELVNKGGAMSPDRTLRLFIPCLDALALAHSQGVVHKDLKPGNLFITDPGERRELLRILDFGIAHLGREGDARLTGTGRVLGTPAYLAPEYIAEQKVSPALDVYQMGLILVETLSGVAVVNHTNPLQCIALHGRGDIEIPQALVASPLGPVLAKALSLNPEERYADAGEFCEALAEIDPASIPSSDVMSEGSVRVRDSADLMYSGGPSTPAGSQVTAATPRSGVPTLVKVLVPLGVLVVVGIAVVVALVISGGGRGGEGPESGAVAPAAEEAKPTKPDPEPAEPEVTPPPVREVPAQPAAVEMVEITLRSQPDGVTVTQDAEGRQALGVTPYVYHAKRGAEGVVVYLHQRGYSPERIELNTGRSMSYDVVLKKKRRAKKAGGGKRKGGGGWKIPMR
jgi:serine/threonine-protein kinase